MTFEITLMGLPKLPNNIKGWQSKMVNAKKWREASKNAAMKPDKPRWPFQSVRLTLIRASAKQCDFDNLIASFKPIIDGLKDAGIITDDNPNVVSELIPRWTKVSQKLGYVKVIVEEL